MHNLKYFNEEKQSILFIVLIYLVFGSGGMGEVIDLIIGLLIKKITTLFCTKAQGDILHYSTIIVMDKTYS